MKYHDCDGHFINSHGAVLGHDLMRMGGDEADEAARRFGRRGSGMAGIVESGFRIPDDIHGRNIWRVLVGRMDRVGQLGPVHLVAGQNHFLDGGGLDIDEPARRLAQAPGQGRQIFLLRHAERAALGMAMFDQDIAHPEPGMLDDVLEQNRGFRLGRQRADIIDRDRLGDVCDDIGVGFEVAAQILVERPVVAGCLFAGSIHV